MILDVMAINILSYNRIIIVGNNGSGKSYLAKELSVITGLPLVHLDVEFWRPNWEQPSREEWIKKQIELTAKEKWIIDGNHADTMELRFKATDIIIFLDINRFVCLTSVIKRNGKERSDSPQYLEYKFDREFFRFCKRLWSFSKTRKSIVMSLQQKYPNKPFLVIKSRRKLKKFLDQCRDQK